MAKWWVPLSLLNRTYAAVAAGYVTLQVGMFCVGSESTPKEHSEGIVSARQSPGSGGGGGGHFWFNGMNGGK